jgi:hypothetical protein
MSSYLSTEYRISQPIELPNVNIIRENVKQLQGQYDVNKAIVDQTLAKYKSLRGRRDIDNQYIAAKIKEAESVMKSYGQNNGDLAFSSVRDSMTSALANVYEDPFVKNAVLVNQKINQFDLKVDELKKGKNSDKFDAGNYRHALYKAGVDDYDAGKTDSIGNLEYVEFIDKNKVGLDVIKQLKDLKGKEVIEVPDPYNEGYTIKKTIEGLTADEIFKYLPDLLPSNVNAQMEIDAWKKYGSDEKKINSDFDSYSTATIKRLDENIATLKKETENKDLPDNVQKQAKASYDSLLIQKKEKEEFFDSVKNSNYTQKATYLESSSWKANIANAAQARESKERGKDEVYFAKKSLEMDSEKHQMDMAKGALDMKKTQLEIDEKTKSADTENGAVDVVMSTKEDALLKDINPYTDQQKEFSEATIDMNKNILEVVNQSGIPQTVKNDFIAKLNKNGYDINGNIIKGKEDLAAKITKTDAMYEAFSGSNMSKQNSDATANIHRLNLQRSVLEGEINSVKLPALEANWDKNSKSYIDRLYNTEVKFVDNNYDVRRPNSKYTLDLLKGANISEADFDKMNRVDKRKTFEQLVYDKVDGGWDDKKSQKELLKIADLIPNYKDNLEETANKTKKNNIANGVNKKYTTANIATIPAGQAQYYIDRLPQDQKTQIFDNKSPLSYYKKPDGTIAVIQNAGLGESDKRGVYSKPPKEVVLGSKDELYGKLTGLMEQDETRQNTSAYIMKKPIFAERQNQTYLPTNSDHLVDQGKIAINKLPKEIFNGVNPELYLNKIETGEIFQASFGRVVGEDKINTLVETISSNMSKVDLKLSPEQNQWYMSLNLSNGNRIKNLKTNMTTIDPNFNNVFQEYPQVLITHIIADDLRSQKTEKDLKNRVDYFINNFK